MQYLEDDVVGGLADAILWLQAVLSGQGYSGTVETPVLLPLQLQDEHLKGEKRLLFAGKGKEENSRLVSLNI